MIALEVLVGNRLKTGVVFPLLFFGWDDDFWCLSMSMLAVGIWYSYTMGEHREPFLIIHSKIETTRLRMIFCQLLAYTFKICALSYSICPIFLDGLMMDLFSQLLSPISIS